MVTNNFAVALQQVSMGYQDTGIRVVSNDVDVNTLTIKVYNAGAEIAYNELSSGTITFVKEDRNVVQADLTINATNITYMMGTNEIAIPGSVRASIQLFGSNGERLTPAKFRFYVDSDLVSPSAVQSTTEFPILQQLKAELEGISVVNLTNDFNLRAAEYASRAEIHFIKSEIIKDVDDITVLDNGGGDSILICLPSGENILVDTYASHNATRNVIPYLQGLGITKLDYVILTHCHVDHVGGFDVIAQNFEITNVILGDTPDFNHAYFNDIKAGIQPYYDAVMAAISTYSFNVIHPAENQVINVGKAKLTFMNTDCTDYYSATNLPASNQNTLPTDIDYNNFSLIFQFEYGKTKAFFSGDLGSAGQLKYQDIVSQCDIYKVEHHALNYMVNTTYYESLSPKLAIASTIFTLTGGYTNARYFGARNIPLHATMTENIILEISDFNYQLIKGHVYDIVKPTLNEFVKYYTIDLSGSTLYSLRDAISIPNGADLNEYTDFGNYVCASAAVAATLSSAPYTDGGFVMHVERCTGDITGATLKQIAIPNSTKIHQLTRHRLNGVWGSWQYAIYSNDSNFTTNDATLLNSWTGTLKYFKNSLGMVIVQGSITAGTVTAGTAICTLPVEYRPSYNKAFPVYVDSDGKSEIGLYMSTTGNLTIRLPASSTIVAGKAIALNFMYQAA